MAATAAPSDVVDAVASSLKVAGAALARAVMVEIPVPRRNDRGWPVALFAAEIEGAEFAGEVGVWAVGEPPTVGPVMAIDDVAREYTAWGEAARSGSRADGVRAHLAGYPEVAAARGAVSAR